MMLLFLLVFGLYSESKTAVCQVIAEISPQIVSEDTPVNETVKISCRLHRNSKEHIRSILILQLYKRGLLDKEKFPLAELPVTYKDPPRFVPKAPMGIRQRSRVTGRCDVKNFTNNELTLEINVSRLKTSDAGEYQCELTYQKLDWLIVQTVQSANLTLFLPESYYTAGKAMNSAGNATNFIGVGMVVFYLMM